MGHYGLAATILLLILVILLGVFIITGIISVNAAVEQSVLLTLLGAGAVLVTATAVLGVATSRPTGPNRFNNQIATVIADLIPNGRVQVHGENWAATLAAPYAGMRVAAGAQVRVVGMVDLNLVVVPLATPPVQKSAS
jgi:membrane-bound ClpP family serine protease